MLYFQKWFSVKRDRLMRAGKVVNNIQTSHTKDISTTLTATTATTSETTTPSPLSVDITTTQAAVLCQSAPVKTHTAVDRRGEGTTREFQVYDFFTIKIYYI